MTGGRVLPDSDWLMRAALGKNAPGAWPVGTLVKKAKCRPGDLHPVGSLATVRGSIGPFPHEGNPRVYGYLLEFADVPYAYVFTNDVDGRLELVDG